VRGAETVEADLGMRAGGFRSPLNHHVDMSIAVMRT
jgi:hypothetical protein